MNRYIKYTLAILVSLAGFHQTSGAQEAFGPRAALTKQSILIGEQTQLHLSVRFHAKDSIGFPKLADSIGSKIKIAGGFKADTVFDKVDNSIETITRHYNITAFDSGTYTIPSYAFKLPVGVMQTDSLILDVKTVAVDTTKAFYDIKQPLAIKYNFWDWLRDNWKLVVGILAAMAATGGVVYYLLKRPKKEVVAEEPKPIKPPHVIALEKLAEIKGKQLWQQEQVKEYYIEISDVVRDYLEQRYNIQALEQTSEEIFASLKTMDIASEDRNLLRQLLVLSDMVKFAKEKPTPFENEKSMENAVSFVKDTQPAAAPVNTKEDEAK
ncbi:hypothetical protein [Mucilaginibacter celer]|uniref:Protein BatD n=1 Tax=Mucilaginibacter celer TaxID=2305508 RepID=A0A494VU59_9SPHI|nr:hypothetical protein [Mucilaginibacter celer]AYL97909.1 hypothetical protein HYN43_022585 [Mucilaginibacter celer]